MSISNYVQLLLTKPDSTVKCVNDGFVKLSKDSEKTSQYLLIDAVITLVVVVAFKAIAGTFAALTCGLGTFVLLGSYQCWTHGSTAIGRAANGAVQDAKKLVPNVLKPKR